MKKLIIIISILGIQFFFNNSRTYAQELKLGATLDFLTGNKYIDWEVGPTLIIGYKFQKLPLSVRGVTRFYLSQINGREFSAGYTFTSFNIGAAVNYYPIKWAIEPYVGVGIFYNSNGVTQSGNTSPEYNGTIRALKIEKNFSTEITGGIKFSADSPINFIVEITQTFNNPGKLVISDFDSGQILKKEDINFNSIFLKLGLLFRI